MLTLLVFLGALSTIHQNSFLPIPSVVRAQSTSSTAVASIVPQNISDFSKVAGSIVTYNVTVAAAPSISSFAVWIQFDPQVLNASNNAISSAGNVLGSDAQVRSECINGEVVLGQACQAYPLSDFGVVSLELFTLGGKTTSVPTSGLLFQLTLRVVKAESFSRVHFLQVVLANGITNENYPSTNVDGFFTNKHCGSVFCKPPLVDFTFSPTQPSLGSTVMFNATASKATNAGAKIAKYIWFWEEICNNVFSTQDVPDPIIPHTFCNAHTYYVTLTVTDTLGISWAITKGIQVVYIFVDVTYGGIDLDHQYNVYPGTVVHITAGILNKSTVPVNANLSITLDTGVALGNKSFTLSGGGTAGSITGKLGPVPWDTTNFSPRVYRIDVKVSSNVPQNVTNDKSTSTYIQLIVVPPGGTLSLSLIQTTGLGLNILIGLAAGLARFRKKPNWEREPL